MMQHKLNIQHLSRQCKSLHKQLLLLRRYSVSPAPEETNDASPVNYCRKEPIEHTNADLLNFYSISPKSFNGELAYAAPKRFKTLCDSIHDRSLLIRQPALDIINEIKEASDNVPKFLLFGPDGSGKSLTLMHVLHYCLQKNMVVIHIPNAVSMVDTQQRTTLLESAWKSSRVDQPAESINWLNMFKSMNTKFLLEAQTTKDYSWGKREMTEKGKPLMTVLEQGVGRTAYANDAVGVILKEIRQNKDLEVLFAVDAINGFFSQTSHRMGGKTVHINDLSLVHHFTKLMKPEYALEKGAYVMSVSRNVQYLKPAVRKREVYSVMKNLFDRYALARFQDYTHVEVPFYTEEEFLTMMHYYKEQGWIARDLSGKLIEEVRFLTSRCPTSVRKILSSI